MAGLVGIRGRADCGVILAIFKPGDRTSLEFMHSDELSSVRPEDCPVKLFTDCLVKLYYTILYYTILYCTVLYYTILY